MDAKPDDVVVMWLGSHDRALAEMRASLSVIGAILVLTLFLLIFTLRPKEAARDDHR